jgi:hypothetical protein
MEKGEKVYVVSVETLNSEAPDPMGNKVWDKTLCYLVAKTKLDAALKIAAKAGFGVYFRCRDALAKGESLMRDVSPNAFPDATYDPKIINWQDYAQGNFAF